MLTTSGLSSGALPLSLMPVLRSRLTIFVREAHARGQRERVGNVPVDLAERRDALVLDVLHTGGRVERHEQAVERVLQQRTAAAHAAVRIDRAIEPVVLRGGREPGAGVIAPGAAIVRDVVHLQVVETGLVVGELAERAADAQLLAPLLVVVPEAAGVAIHVEHRAFVVDRLEVIVLVRGDGREVERARIPVELQRRAVAAGDQRPRVVVVHLVVAAAV